MITVPRSYRIRHDVAQHSNDIAPLCLQMPPIRRSGNLSRTRQPLRRTREVVHVGPATANFGQTRQPIHRKLGELGWLSVT
jgi:hypothetical protein